MSSTFEASSIKWGEFIHVLSGRYWVSTIVDEDGNATPCLHNTREDVEKEIEDSVNIYNQEIEDGERDEDDEYEGNPEQHCMDINPRIPLLWT